MEFEINEKIKEALKLIEEGKNVFITGRAGTGKSTLLKYFRDKTDKNTVVVAPTGVAALNVKGQTIHSFFRFKPDITPDKVKKITIKNKEIYKKIDILIIDEISMVRADLFDSMDIFMKRFGKRKNKPFGGVQIICFGDLYQLKPVVNKEERHIFYEFYDSPYFFSSLVFNELNMEYVELEKIYRQKDDKFIDLLNKIRNNTVEEKDLEILNSRYIPDFEHDIHDTYVYLVTKNEFAEKINKFRLGELKGKQYIYYGTIEGEFEKFKDKKEYLPCPEKLVLKKDAQVMLVNNDPKGRWVNGSVGRIVNIERGSIDTIYVRLTSGETVSVNPVKWELFKYYYDKTKKKIDTETIGIFIQYPIILSWAITIHKSQGKTFDKVIIDLTGGVFTAGQFYVAVSRCTTLDGLILKTEVTRQNIFNDWRIVNFVTKYQYRLSNEKINIDKKRKLIENAIAEGKRLEIEYLKPKDERSRRIIEPFEVGEFDYKGVKFLGVKGIDDRIKEERIFRIDRILSLKIT